MLGLDVVEIPVSNAELNVEELNSRLSEVDEEVDRESWLLLNSSVALVSL